MPAKKRARSPGAAAAAAASAAVAKAAAKREAALICHVCTELLCAPISLPCGHTFCKVCLDKWLPTNRTCPTCRAAVPAVALAVNRALAEIIRDNAGPLFTARCAEAGASLCAALEEDDVDEARAVLAGAGGMIALEGFVGDEIKKATPLLFACAKATGDNVVKWVKLARELVDAGADVLARDVHGSTLMAAARANAVAADIILFPLLFAKGVRDAAAFKRTACTRMTDLSADTVERLDCAFEPHAKDASVLRLAAADRISLLEGCLRNGLGRCAVALLAKKIRASSDAAGALLAVSGGSAAALKALPAVPHGVVVPAPLAQTLLHVACVQGQAAAALALVEMFTKEEIEVRDGCCVAAVDYARRYGGARGMAAVVAAIEGKDAEEEEEEEEEEDDSDSS